MSTDNINITQIVSKIDTLLKELQNLNNGNMNKIYTTKELSQHLRVGKSVIDKLRQNGEISYSKVGQTIVFTHEDVEDYLIRNKVKYAG